MKVKKSTIPKTAPRWALERQDRLHQSYHFQLGDIVFVKHSRHDNVPTGLAVVVGVLEGSNGYALDFGKNQSPSWLNEKDMKLIRAVFSRFTDSL
jgi:hypothetical protein